MGAWITLSLGIMSLVFGGALLAWSVWSDRQELWTIGLPFALAGQAALVVGLVLQIDAWWQTPSTPQRPTRRRRSVRIASGRYD